MKPELPPNGATFKQAMNEPVYTADQMRAYGKECARMERERCAKIADSYTKHHVSATIHYEGRWQDAKEYHAARMDAGAQIRDAIRKEPE